MQRIRADGYVVEFDDQNWHMSKLQEDLRTTTSILSWGYAFEATRNDPMIRYTPEFAQQVNLPGNALSTRYARAVLVGYHEQSKRWILGLHLARDDQEKPTFRAIVQWSSTDQGDQAKIVARALAAVLSVPLSIYGDKKEPTPSRDASRSGVTGPLEAHRRLKLGYDQVAAYVEHLTLPIQGNGFTLVTAPTGFVLKLTKATGKGKVEIPVFTLCEINTRGKLVKLIPPTGLLSAFTRDRTREIPFGTIFNVEHRITHAQVIQEHKTADKGTVEEVAPLHIWGIYLTLKDESLLLLQASYAESLKLRHSKVELVGATKLETNSADGLKYFREHLEEKETIDSFANQTEQVAYWLAGAFQKPLVKSEVSS